MPDAHSLKSKLIGHLWLPTAQKCGNILYPRLRKNKNMKLFTLTSDTNYQEITTFEQNKLTKRECIIAWNFSHIKKWRLETEISPAKVLGPARYENFTLNTSSQLSVHFPFHIMNLDFSSQDPVSEVGRIEAEINSLEYTVKLQKEKDGNCFCLIYTTILNSHNLDHAFVENSSNNIHVSGWPGLCLEGFPLKIDNQADKMRFLESVLARIYLKYGYSFEIKLMHVSFEKESKQVCSIAAMIYSG